MTDRELLQQALDMLDDINQCSLPPTGIPLPAEIDEVMEALRAALAQPEPAECDGGQCGIGGYCKECPKPLVKLKEMLEVQGRNGTWNYDPYFHGMYNGMEVMLAVLEGREPVFREAPEKWLSKKEWVGLTDEEIKECAKGGRSIGISFHDAIQKAEAKLKEKNT